MPNDTYVQLPNGSYVQVPSDATVEQLSALKAKLSQFAPKPSEADQAAALAPSTMQQARLRLIPAELRPQSRALQQSMGGMPQFVDVPSDEKQAFEQAGQRGYERGGKIGAALTLGVPNAVTAPVATALGAAGSAGGSYLARKGAEKLGADPDVQDIAEGVGGVVGGVTGGALGTGAKVAARSLLFTPQNRFAPTRPLELAVRSLTGQAEDTPAQTLQSSVDRAVKRALLLRDARASAGLGAPVGSPQQESGWTPNVTKMPFPREGGAPVTVESIPGPDTAGKGNLLTPAARRGVPGAGDELVRRGRLALFTPDPQFSDAMTPDEFRRLLAGLDQ